MSETLFGATNHYNYDVLPKSKIILSPEVYGKLCVYAGLARRTARTEFEYATLLYGNEIEHNVIDFSESSAIEDHDLTPREVDINTDIYGNCSKMVEELRANIKSHKYGCIAHVHTHPYVPNFGSNCQYFSNQDMLMLKTLQEDFQYEERKKDYLAGLIFVPEDDTPAEISFVFYDANGKKFYRIQDITVHVRRIEMSLRKNAGRTILML